MCSGAVVKKEKDEKTLFFRLYKKNLFNCSVAEKISKSIEASSAPPTNPVPSVEKAIKMVKNCGCKKERL